jgi:hypothetical protein
LTNGFTQPSFPPFVPVSITLGSSSLLTYVTEQSILVEIVQIFQ